MSCSVSDLMNQSIKIDHGMCENIFPVDRFSGEVHASTLEIMSDGSILASWFGGSKEGKDDVAIWLSRRSDHGWSDPKIVAKINEEPHWNPVLFDHNGKTWLWFKVGKDVHVWRTYLITSDDAGYTWSEPTEVIAGDIGGRGPVKNKPICLSDGTILAPASIEIGKGENARWDAFVDHSNNAIQWNRSALVHYDHLNLRGEGVIQPTLWESQPGIVHMLLRSGDGWINRSDSIDGGKTWCDAYPIDLPNNNSGIDLVRLNDGTLALLYNPISENWGERSPLTLALSMDNGQTWPVKIDLETEKGEYSYPAIIARDHDLFMTYTNRRKTITYRKVTVQSKTMYGTVSQ
jgi:predicted neuraminidase